MGAAQVYVIGKGDLAVPRKVAAEHVLGDSWIVTAGLADGDRIITQGLGKLKPGKPVRPAPETAPQAPGGALHRISAGKTD
jgi:membrane fusion protein (multidrug efflux system)